MSKSSNPGPIPERWLHCPRKSNGLIADKFVAFKTPLAEKFNEQVPEECRFHASMVFSSMKSYKVKIGLWIDLTNTTRFYDRQDVESEDCKYVKLQCRGHGGAPDAKQTNAFIYICQKFVKSNPTEAIAVHCTHGFNRTGFLIVAFMVVQMDCSVEAAISHFGHMRSPGIYKKDYLQELFQRYDDTDCTLPVPELPSWCFESDDTPEPVEEANGNSSGSSNGPRRREFQKKNPTFMEGIPNVTVVTDKTKVQEVQKKVQSMCGWKSSGFPGCQPVSMNMTNINLLRDKPYRVSWKADGTRYMMLIWKAREIYFVDRDNSVFQVEGLTFPYKKYLDRYLTNTLLDGEMVIDKYQGKIYPRYLVYDIVQFEGNDISKLPFYPDRCHFIEREVLIGRRIATEQGRIIRSSEPFGVRAKQFWDLTQAESLLGEKFARSLSHEPDGLIFQPSEDPYVAGQCSSVLKWKPLSMNSVDFKLKIVTEQGQGILTRKIGHLYVGGAVTPFSSIPLNKTLKELDNKIIECRFDVHHSNQWVFMRERTDKSFPNSYDTAMAVCNSIQDPVTKERLLHFIDHERWGKDRELMPPPGKVPRR